MNSAKPSLLPLAFFIILQICGSIASTYHDTITPNQRIRDGDFLISSGQVFALGFFSPAGSTGRYVGIWFNNASVKPIVWTANRDTPANDASGVLSVTPGGNLVLLAQNHTIWSSNVSVPTNHPRVRLLDSGNLVLSGNGVITWQSFDYPTDTYLPHMKLGLDRRTGLNRVMRSWKSKDDPGTGVYSHAIDPTGFPQAFVYKGADPLWRMGSWTGVKWSGVPEMDSSLNISTVTFVDTQDEVYVSHGVTDESLLVKLVLDTSGFLRLSTWNEPARLWFEYWNGPKESCDYYETCGANSICDQYNTQGFHCQCLPEYNPKSPTEWALKNGSGGCVGASICDHEAEFVKVSHVKLPDTRLSRVNMSFNLEECQQECRRNCSCKAYAYADERWRGCMTWHGDLIDIRTYTISGQDLHVRVPSPTLGKHEDDNHSSHRRWMLPLFICLAIMLALLVATFIYCKVSTKTKGEPMTLSFSKLRQGSANAADLPVLFDLATISAATDNFSFVNKLGQGGFGPVYKGHLLDGKDIAVKRLSKNSGQGAHEFKNEVSLIARLQHRNLVKILGYCIEEEETMLVYEYLPNKSLDFFLFDETKRSLLDWTKRFNIIYGVARGILYLHEDSRLRIVHRDLKASNVLLDAAMNPKISDFGMARIFGEDETEGNTKRVVGTYGYMSPEYAMEGLFSTKSDVYSFGVLLLEVVTGKRNTGCYYHEQGSTLNLIGHVWEVWTRGMALEIVDETMEENYGKDEVMRCIQIGLLCVQEFAADRPTSSAVVFMLGNHDPSYQLPSPNQPAFSCKRSDKNEQHPTSGSQGACSTNSLTISLVEPR